MAWQLDGTTIIFGKAFTVGTGSSAIQYPANWMNQTTVAEKEAIGLVEVADPANFSNEYWVGYDDNNILIPRQFADETSGGITTEGLRTFKSNEQKKIAGLRLDPTDWYVVRNSETNDAIPVGITSFRTETRSTSNTREQMILACEDMYQLESLCDGIGSSTITGYSTTFLPEWPELEDYYTE